MSSLSQVPTNQKLPAALQSTRGGPGLTAGGKDWFQSGRWSHRICWHKSGNHQGYSLQASFFRREELKNGVRDMEQISPWQIGRRLSELGFSQAAAVLSSLCTGEKRRREPSLRIEEAVIGGGINQCMVGLCMLSHGCS